ncbi:sugar efflux transporter [Streptomyces sp. NRRL WC-3742]|uniref:sugar efflux transporter n=1 Tax=Streptomyces sp. NRRL WC-3742 TaxID=1463934 RepID=UPI00068D008D|nr:sugar efflux transporter [Streptomyces sp. NRRL WC-3742]
MTGEPVESAALLAPARTTGRWHLLADRSVLNLIAANGVVGLAGAFAVPTTSLFLKDVVGATPLMIGLFFAVRSIGEIGTDLAMGVVSDRLRDRRMLLVLTALFNTAGALCYSVLRDYYLLLPAGLVLFGLGGACFGQLFAYTRELAEQRQVDASFFNGLQRSVTSLAWVIGPPVAFWMVARWSFTVLYGAAACLSLLAGVISRWGLPALPPPAPVDRDAEASPGLRGLLTGLGPRTALLLASIVLLLGANAMYQINLSLRVTAELHLSSSFTGLLLGLSAVLEIPLIIMAGAWAERIGKARLLLTAAVCATLFFAALPTVHGQALLLLLQLPNAFWTAVVMNIPVIMLQDSLPGRPGTASSLYSSAFKTGMFLGGLVVGTVATWTGYGQVFWVCAGLTALAGLLVLASERAGTPAPTSEGNAV